VIGDDDLEDFLDPEEFGTLAEVDGETVRGIVLREPVEVLGAAGVRTVLVIKSRPTHEGAPVAVGGVDYRVAYEPERDGTGLERLVLEVL
jgi:hypothetical protein